MSAPEPLTANVPEETVELPATPGDPTSDSAEKASAETSGVGVRVAVGAAVPVRVGVPATTVRVAVRVGVRVCVRVGVVAEVAVRVGVGVTEWKDVEYEAAVAGATTVCVAAPPSDQLVKA